MTTMQKTQHVEDVPISLIVRSPFNRVVQDDAQLRELTESIALHGVQQPITVRKIGSGSTPGDWQQGEPAFLYEIVTGERRWLASKLAEKTAVPAMVKEFTDDQVRELQLIENLQRKDVHPIEEADAYAKIRERSDDKSIEAIARRVSKEIGYVTKRLALLTLSEQSRALFMSNDFTLDHALLLATLNTDTQHKALRTIFDPNGWRRNDTIAKLVEDTRDTRKSGDRFDARSHRIASVGELRSWIEKNVALELKGVEWDLNDATLHPDAGSCTECPKRTGANAGLFGGLLNVKESTCMDGECFAEKRKRFVQITLANVAAAGKSVVKLSHKETTQEPTGRAPKEGQPDRRTYRRGQWIAAKPGSCEHVVTGVFVDRHKAPSWGGDNYKHKGMKVGSHLSVCVSPKCKTHKKSYQAGGQRDSTAAANAHHQQELRARQLREQIELPLRVEAVNAIVDVAVAIDDRLIRLLLDAIAQYRIDTSRALPLLAKRIKTTTKKPTIETYMKELFDHSDLHKSKEAAQAIAALSLSRSVELWHAWNETEMIKERGPILEAGSLYGIRPQIAAIFAKYDVAIAKANGGKKDEHESGTCRYCKCVEERACVTPSGPCAWADDKQTVCTNSDCLIKARKDRVTLRPAALHLLRARKISIAGATERGAKKATTKSKASKKGKAKATTA